MRSISPLNALRISATCLSMLAGSIAGAVSLCPDDFEAGTTLGWQEGFSSFTQPTNVTTGGPAGAGDNYLENVSTGFGAGGKMTMFNQAQWQGDFMAAGVTAIRAHVKVETSSVSALTLRVGFQNVADLGFQRGYASFVPVVVQNDGNWHEVTFPIASTDLVPVGGTFQSYNQTMSDVRHFRIYHSTNVAWRHFTEIEATMGIDNIKALADEYQGWLWSPEVDLSGLEEYCNARLDMSVGSNLIWNIGGSDESCPGRTTTNTGRIVENPAPGNFRSCGTQPFVSAGGNLFELFGEDVENGVGLGEDRIAAFLSAPSDGNLLMAGGYEGDGTGQEYSGFVAMLAKSTPAIKEARTATDLENTTWRLAFTTRRISSTNVNTEVASTSIYTVDLEPGGVCTFSNSGVFAPDFVDNRDSVTALQNDDGMMLDNRNVLGGVNGANASNCSYSIDADNYLVLTYTRTLASDPGNPTVVTLRRVVADNNRFLVWAPADTSPVGNPTSLHIGYQAPTAMVPGDIDGTFLFHVVVSEFDASGTGHSMGAMGGIEFDNMGRGKIVFDSLTPGTVPPGQIGNWFSCDAEMVSNEEDRELSGMTGDSSVTITTTSSTEDFPFTSCDYNVEADGALRLFLTLVEAGDPDPVELLFRGYVNDNGELFSLVDFEPKTGAVGLADFAAVRFLLGMKYTGDPDGNEDGDDFTNFEEFKLPLPTPLPLPQDLTAFIDVSGDGIADFASFIDDGLGGGPKIDVLSGANGSNVSTISFFNVAWTGRAIEAASDGNSDGVANDPAIAVLGFNPATSATIVQVRMAMTGAFVRNIQFFNPAWTKPLDIIVIDDVDGDGNTDDAAIGVLALNEATNAIAVQVKRLSNGSTIATRYFLNPAWSPRAAAAIVRSGQTPLIGVMAVNPVTGSTVVQSRQLSDGAVQANTYYFNVAWRGQDVAAETDLNSDGTADDPAWMVMATNDSSNNSAVQVRSVNTGAVVKNIFFLNPAWESNRVTGSGDISGNLISDVAGMARNRTNDNIVIQVRDYGTTAVIRNIFP